MSTEQNRPIFALDIGTRSVVGLILRPQGEQFHIEACEVMEHQERSMLDGQIHDIVAVADVINKLKSKLEEKHGPLKEVSVAAAGRALKTQRTEIEKSIENQPLLTKDDVLSLELAAVQHAQSLLAKEEQNEAKNDYYCVGYSVVNYFLDNEVIGNLIDQRGKKVKVEIIATFLPRIVVDSLLAALKRASLNMKALTLEPIAAINVLIPPSMRRLNVALVDIGAGTTDIAITAEGTVTAYGMIPIAGDEVTEAIGQHYLLDFPIAEEVKRKLSVQDEVSFQDILGIEHTVSKRDMVLSVEPTINQLAEAIAEKIVEINGHPPQAVMMIGGGSQTPALAEKTAQKLGLPAQRVAIRGTEAIEPYIGKDHPLSGPEFVTPVGIAISALKHPVKYLTVEVNDNTVRTFDLRQMKVGDALLAAGTDMKRLHGRPGIAMTVTINGKIKMIPGGHGTPPTILRNGEEAHLDTELLDGDTIEVIRGEDGANASATVKDVIDVVDTLDVSINGEPYSLPPFILINGESKTADTPLHDRDEIRVKLPTKIREIFEHYTDYSPDDFTLKKIKVILNEEAKEWIYEGKKVLVNEKEASLNDRIRPGDQLQVIDCAAPLPTVKDFAEDAFPRPVIQITFNGQPVRIELNAYSLYVNGQKADPERKISDGDRIEVKPSEEDQAIFSDVFRYVDIDIHNRDVKGTLVTTVNDKPAEFFTPIKNGDKLELKWE